MVQVVGDRCDVAKSTTVLVELHSLPPNIAFFEAYFLHMAIHAQH